MRHLAVAAALVVLAFAVPPAGANTECFVNPQSPRVCEDVPIASPHPSVPIPATTVYVMADGAACKEGRFADCFGVVWLESNGCTGLQRATSTACGGKPADRRLAT